MNKAIKRIIIYIVILGLGIFIGWWINEIYRFAEGMKKDKAPNIDTLNQVLNIDSLTQTKK